MNSFNVIFKPFDSKIHNLKSYYLKMMFFSDLSNKLLVDKAR